MRPALRKVIYAICFETLGVAVASAGLLAMSEASVGQSVSLSVVTATVALCWSYLYNSLFEAWEARQTVRGRSFARRSAHALIFEGGLVLILVPVMAWWWQVGLLEALVYDGGEIGELNSYTYVFTWGFDRIFGLPASAR